jgi:hypothetical protein
MSNNREETAPPSTTDAWDHLRWWGATIAALVWLTVYVQSASSRGGDAFGFWFMVEVGWLIASLGLVGFWIVVAVVAIRAWISRNTARAWRATAFLVPFPLAVAAAILLSANDLPLHARFQLSEGSLNRLADQYERSSEGKFSGWSGLYHVQRVHTWENCTVIVTGSFIFDEYGFARCSGPPPKQLPWNIELEELKGNWWTYLYRD